MQIPFCGPTYQGRSNNIDASRCINFYPEINPNQQSGKGQVSLVGTPGTILFRSTGEATPVRGSHVFNNKMYIVVGTKLISVASDGSLATITSSLNAGATGRVKMLDNGLTASGAGGNQLFIVDGVKGYIYNVVTTVFTTLSSPFPANPIHAEYMDGYFIVTDGSMTHWTSNSFNGLTWNALTAAIVGATPDNIVGIGALHEALFFFKEYTTEVWYNAGTPTSEGSPFARQSGAVFDYGCAARWSIAHGGASLFMIANQRQNSGGEVMGVVEIAEYQPKLISTPAIGYLLTNSTTIANCFAYCYASEGHSFYVLTNPDDDWTIVYDTTTGMWHERSSFNTTPDSVKRHVGNTYSYFNGKHYLGDYRFSNLFEMSSEYVSDNGQPIISVRTSPILSDTDKFKEFTISRLTLDAEVGTGGSTIVIVLVTPRIADGTTTDGAVADGTYTAGGVYQGLSNPQIELTWSNDAGRTWSSSPMYRSLGSPGDYDARVHWDRLGSGLNKVMRIVIREPIKKVIVGAYIE